jgi:hypothetical protein
MTQLEILKIITILGFVLTHIKLDDDQEDTRTEMNSLLLSVFKRLLADVDEGNLAVEIERAATEKLAADAADAES